MTSGPPPTLHTPRASRAPSPVPPSSAPIAQELLNGDLLEPTRGGEVLDVIENQTVAQRAVEPGRVRAGDPRRGFDSQTAIGAALDTQRTELLSDWRR